MNEEYIKIQKSDILEMQNQILQDTLFLAKANRAQKDHLIQIKTLKKQVENIKMIVKDLRGKI